jgi:hypothetical protein
MRGILINPNDRTISEIEHAGGFEEMNRLIDAATGTTLRVTQEPDGSGDFVWLDDDGLLTPAKAVWKWSGYPHPLAGIGLVFATDYAGETVTSNIAAAIVREAVVWTDLETTGVMEGERELPPSELPPGITFGFTTGDAVLRPRTAPKGGAL